MRTHNSIIDTNGGVYRHRGIPYGDDLTAGVYEISSTSSFLPHGSPLRYLKGPGYVCSRDMSAEFTAVFFSHEGDVTDEVYLAAGVELYIPSAVGFRVLAVHRAGTIKMVGLDDGERYTQTFTQSRYPRNVQLMPIIFPTIKSTVATDVWTFAGDAQSPVSGLTGEIFDAGWRSIPSLTTSHWTTLWLVAMSRDYAGALTNIRRLVNLTNLSIGNTVLHAHDEFGVWAVPSATNPSPAAAPMGGVVPLALSLSRPHVRVGAVNGNGLLV